MQLFYANMQFISIFELVIVSEVFCMDAESLERFVEFSKTQSNNTNSSKNCEDHKNKYFSGISKGEVWARQSKCFL